MGKRGATVHNVSAKSRKVSREIGTLVEGNGDVAFKKDIVWAVDELNKKHRKLLASVEPIGEAADREVPTNPSVEFSPDWAGAKLTPPPHKFMIVNFLPKLSG